MTTKTQSLTDIISQLIRSPQRRYHTLPKKLTLAYTPGALNATEPGVYRLTLSRRGNWPSEKEIQIVKRDLKAALKAAGRHWSGMAVEEYLKAKKEQRYHVIFWIEAVQAALPIE